MRRKRPSTLAPVSPLPWLSCSRSRRLAAPFTTTSRWLGDTLCTNDTAIQLLRVRQDSPDASSWNNCVKLTFQNAAGALTGEFALHQDPPAGNGFVVGIGTAELASTPGASPIHIVIPSTS